MRRTIVNTFSLPEPAAFDSSAPAPHPRGLVGMHRSARPGQGSEFATLRPFQVGDRLREWLPAFGATVQRHRDGLAVGDVDGDVLDAVDLRAGAVAGTPDAGAIRGSLLLGGSRVAADAIVNGCIIGPGAVVGPTIGTVLAVFIVHAYQALRAEAARTGTTSFSMH